MNISNKIIKDFKKSPLSFSQQRIWILQNLYKDDVMYNTLRCYKIKGPLNKNALLNTVNALALRHEVLRIRLQLSPDGSPFQIVENNPRINIEQRDLRQLSGGNIQHIAEQIIQNVITSPFDIYNEPLLRIILVQLGEEESILLFVKHHLISDYVSWQLFLTEFTTIYTAIITGNKLSLPALPWEYSDFAITESLLLTREFMESKKIYWYNFFADFIDSKAESDRRMQKIKNGETPFYESFQQLIPSDTIGECREVAENHQSTLFIVILTVISLLISYLYRNSKVMLCIANANRKYPEANKVMGCFFMNVIVTLNVQREQKIADLISEVKDIFLKSRKNQNVPFEFFVSEFAFECTRQRRPPYKIYISYRPFTNYVEFKLPHVDLETLHFSTGKNTHEDIIFSFWEKMSGDKRYLDLELLYRSDVFDRKTIEKVSSMMKNLMDGMKKNVNIDVQSLHNEWDNSEDSVTEGTKIKAGEP